MLQYEIVPNKSRDTSAAGGDELRRLNARSLALSALLGTHPPALPARALVALAELFGMAGGTMRTAISRMTAAGEVEASDGWYRLTGRLLERQRAQDVGRRPPSGEWNGCWHTVVAAADQRDIAERRRFRAVLNNHRFGELRPDTWLRPANLPAPELDAAAFVVTGELLGDDRALAARLWDLPTVAGTARNLAERIAELRRTFDLDDRTAHETIPPAFVLAAATLRFLRTEPFLPPALVPASLVGEPWPIDALRTSYAELERDLQTTLRHFLQSHRD